MWAFGFGGAVAPPRSATGVPVGGTVAGLAVDPADRILCTGRFLGAADFAPGPREAPLVGAGGSDLFILRLTADGEMEPERR